MPVMLQPNFLRFNNSIVYMKNSSSLTKILWNYGMDSFSTFFNTVYNKLEGTSLKNTKEL